MTGANLVVWIVTLVTQFCLVQATSQDSQRKTSDRFTGAERVGIGIAIVIFCIGMFLLVPGLRRYLAYEIEINKKDNMSILVARGLAMLAFLFQAGDIFNNFFMSTDSDFQCITPGCGNNWEDIHGNPTRFISNFVMFKGTAATLAIAVTQQVLLWLTPNLRGLTLYFVLIFISVVQYVSWYDTCTTPSSWML